MYITNEMPNSDKNKFWMLEMMRTKKTISQENVEMQICCLVNGQFTDNECIAPWTFILQMIQTIDYLFKRGMSISGYHNMTCPWLPSKAQAS